LSAQNNTVLYNEKCSQILKESEIRFAGIVDKDGKLIAGGFKEGLFLMREMKLGYTHFWNLYQKLLLEKSMMKAWVQLIILQQDETRQYW